jgi:4-amino-4-deoxy-L-arabinose transferase-like glycosyltransferase
VVGFVLGAVVLARILLSLRMIDRPGLQYDETIFVNAATLRVPGIGMFHQVLGIPLMVFQYIGALKSWLYAPIFSLFGTSAATVRVPAVMLVSGCLLLLYLGVRDLVNRSVALLVVVLLALDQSLFWYTRDDVGPSALEFSLKCAAVFCLARFCKRRTMRWVVLLLVVLGAGVFNKLNFIWVVNAAAVISIAVMVRHRASLSAWRRTGVMWFAGLILIYASFGAYYFANHIGSLGSGSSVGSFALRWSQFTRGSAAILSGTSFYDYALGSAGPRELVALVMLVLFTAGGAASIARWRGRSPTVAGMAVGTLLIALQILFTYQATSGWHYIAIFPFFTVVAAYGAYAIALLVLRTPVRSATAMVLAGIAVLTYNGVLFAKYSRAVTGEPRFSAWSPAIYALSRYVEHQPGTVFTTDWGIETPLFTLSPSRRYREETFLMWLPAATAVPAIRAEVAQTPGPKLFLAHAPGKLVFKQTRANLLKAGGARLWLMKTIDGVDGDPVFEVYRWRSAPSTAVVPQNPVRGKR